MHAQLPGMEASDLELSVVGETLTLKGNRTGSGTKTSESSHRREREAGRFVRTLQMPFGVDTERVRARFENGVLEIELPRAASEKPRKITVKSA